MLRRKISSNGVYSGGFLCCDSGVVDGKREPNNSGID
jgi:hypothetical protein